jgi:hypothetical protein
LFLRGHGSQVHAQENGTTIGVTSTTHSSGPLGSAQGDATRNVQGEFGLIYGDVNHPQNLFYRSRLGYTQKGLISGDDKTHFLIFDSSRVVPTDVENRPINTAVRYLIRALP